VLVVERQRERATQFQVAGPALDGQRTLGGRGQHLQRVEQLGGLVDAPQPAQPGRSHDHRVELAGPDLADPRVDVAPDRDDVEAEPERLELRPAAW
jgi:hypothetical protein